MAKKTKAQKRKEKRKQYEWERNVSKNQAKVRFRLDVLFPDPKGWKSMGGFKSIAQVQAYSDEQEAIRKRGDTQILEGIIIDLRTNKQIHRVPPFMPETPEGVGAKGFLVGRESGKGRKCQRGVNFCEVAVIKYYWHRVAIS